MNASRLNLLGVTVMLIGMASALLLYRQDRPSNPNASSEWRDSTLSLTDSKANTRNIELYGGKLQVLMVKWQTWFRRRTSQAILIATISTAIGLACFLLARRV
ncbi:MAG TPA: hypothetical protein VLZ12_01230 [Verrucomicrobiae bacterium]|nr:hypothetical protein [Verrucomicrobiae bacterium]